MSTDLFGRIRDLPQHYNDAGWLQANADELFNDITGALKREAENVSEAVSGLLLVYPHVIHHSDVKQWSKLLQDALMAYEKHFPRPEMDEHTKASRFYLTDHEGDEVIEAEFAVALKRARKRIRAGMIMEAYANLMRKYAFHHGDQFNLDIIKSALALGRQVNEQPAYGELHLSLAYVYTRLGHFDKGLEQAHIAYAYWKPTGEELETALSAYAVGTQLNRQDRFSEALPWLEEAERAFLDLNRPRYRGYIAYEISQHYYAQREFTEAHLWAKTALEEIIRAEHDYARATFEHWLGLTTTRTGNYDDARPLLEASMRYWRGRGDTVKHGQLLYALAYLEACNGNTDDAHQHLEELQSLVEPAAQSPEKDALLTDTDGLRSAINNNTDLSDL